MLQPKNRAGSSFKVVLLGLQPCFLGCMVRIGGWFQDGKIEEVALENDEEGHGFPPRGEWGISCFFTFFMARVFLSYFSTLSFLFLAYFLVATVLWSKRKDQGFYMGKIKMNIFCVCWPFSLQFTYLFIIQKFYHLHFSYLVST